MSSGRTVRVRAITHVRFATENVVYEGCAKYPKRLAFIFVQTHYFKLPRRNALDLILQYLAGCEDK